MGKMWHKVKFYVEPFPHTNPQLMMEQKFINLSWHSLSDVISAQEDI